MHIKKVLLKKQLKRYLSKIPDGEYKHYLKINMKKILEKLNGLIVIQNQIFKDKRGYFTENYNQKNFLKL